MLSRVPANALTNLGAELGMRNRFINGNGIIQQRANLALSGIATGFAADRWIAGLTTGTSVAALAFTSGFAGSSSGKGIYVGGSYTNGTPYFAQRIESLNTQDLNNSNVTVSGLLWQDSGSAQTMLLRLIKPSAADNYASASVLATKSVVVPSGVVTPFNAIFTLGASDATNGLQFDIQANSPVSVSSKNFGISDMQFEKGSVQTLYDFRFVQTELGLCQRYFEIFKGDGSNDYFLSPIDLSSGFRRAIFTYKVEKRVIPTVVIVTTGGTAPQGIQLNTVSAVGPYSNGIASGTYVNFDYITANAEIL